MLVSLFLHPVSYTRKEERDRFAGVDRDKRGSGGFETLQIYARQFSKFV